MARAPFSLAGHTVMPGQRLQIDVPVARLLQSMFPFPTMGDALTAALGDLQAQWST